VPEYVIPHEHSINPNYVHQKFTVAGAWDDDIPVPITFVRVPLTDVTTSVEEWGPKVPNLSDVNVAEIMNVYHDGDPTKARHIAMATVSMISENNPDERQRREETKLHDAYVRNTTNYVEQLLARLRNRDEELEKLRQQVGNGL